MQNTAKSNESLSNNSTLKPKAKECKHCKTSFTGEGEFCCMGCATANKMISGLGLGNFYKYLESQISRNKLNLQNNKLSEEIDMTEFITTEDDGSFILNLLVEGLHCSSCVWLIEEALKKQPNITHARLNMSTRRLVIKWQCDEGEANSSSKGRRLGNDYANLIRKMGYKATAFDPQTLKTENDREQKNMLLALAVAGFASGNIMLMSVALWSTSQEIMGIATRDFIHLISAMIALPAIVFSGRIFFKSAWAAVKNRRTNMDVPISIAIILTTSLSIWQWFQSAEHTYFDSVTMLVFFLLIGRYLDIKSKNKARSAATEMLKMMNNSAILVTPEGTLKNIPASKININDIVQVNVGDKIPVDGEIIEGESEIDTSIITGESIPRAASIGAQIFAGTINLSQTIKVKVTKPSEKSLISEVIKLMEKAEDSSTKFNSISEKAIKIYAPLVYFAGVFTFLFWYIFAAQSFESALVTGISVLIITCPCAFGLAVPTVQVLASGKLFKNGVMLKNGNALEVLSKVTCAIFDKTGTLTLGTPKLLNPSKVSTENLQLAASMAAKSNHPYSKAIAATYNGQIENIEVTEVAGQGLEAEIVSGDNIRLGKPSWAVSFSEEQDDKGITLSKNGIEIVRFEFTDELREDAAQLIKQLGDGEIKTKLISGDNAAEVQKIANQAGIADFTAAALPNQKLEILEGLQATGEVVLMVGDGLNDAPAIAAADVSISPSSAIDITQNSADIVFQGKKLQPIFDAMQLAKKSITIIKQNFAIAFLYNFIAIPVAFLGYVTPLAAAAAMSFSSILVVLNSFRLR